MFDTLVFYAHAREYMKKSGKQWDDFRSWISELNENLLYKGEYSLELSTFCECLMSMTGSQ